MANAITKELVKKYQRGDVWYGGGHRVVILFVRIRYEPKTMKYDPTIMAVDVYFTFDDSPTSLPIEAFDALMNDERCKYEKVIDEG